MKTNPIAFFLLAAALASPVLAQTTTMVIQSGKIQGGNATPAVAIPIDQKLMFDAQSHAVQRDFQGAERLYSQAIAANGNNVEAYLQRGLMRRELGNEQGVMSDASAAVTLANNAVMARPNDPLVYYQRGMGYRLAHQYDQAKKDIATGIRLGGKPSWQTEIEAIDMEAKAGR